MIIVDETETRAGSRLHLDGAPTSPILEAVTGADVMVTTLELPATTEALVKRHVEAGALLVQRKSGRDLAESCTRGIKVSLARMHAAGAEWWQCCILASGVFMPDVRTGKVLVGEPELHSDGRITFRWSKTTVDYKAFVTAKRRLRWRGGWLEIVSCNEEIPGWLRNAERDLLRLKAEPVKEIYPELHRFPPDDCEPFQELREIRDARTVLAALKHIGPKRAGALWDAIRAWNEEDRPEERGWTPESWEPTLNQMFFWATAEDPGFYGLPKVPGYGPGVRASVRAQFPLLPGQDFGIVNTYVPEEKEKS